MLIETDKEFRPSRSIALACISAALWLFGWFWIAANFTAAESAWWNSGPAIQAIFLVGIIIGFLSRLGAPRSGLWTTLWAAPTFLNTLSMVSIALLIGT